MILNIHCQDYPGAMGDVLSALSGYKIKGSYTNPAFPQDCEIVEVVVRPEMGDAMMYELVVCDLDEDGAAQRHLLTRIGFDEIITIAVV